MAIKISAPQIKIAAPGGEFDLLIRNDSTVQITGEIVLHKKLFPFALIFKKQKEGWCAVECGAEKVAQYVLDVFLKWEKAHPRIFTMAGRMAAFNYNPHLSRSPRKVTLKKS